MGNRCIQGISAISKLNDPACSGRTAASRHWGELETMSATPNVTRCNTDNPTKQDLQKPSWRRSLSDLHHRGRSAFKWDPSPVWPHRPPGFRGRDAAGPSGTAEIHSICRLAGLVLFPWQKGKEMEIQLPAPLPTAAEIGCQASFPCLTVVIFGKKHITTRAPQSISCVAACGIGC